MSVLCRLCCKTPEMPWDQFLGNRPNKPQSPNDVASRPLPKSPVGSSLDGVVPQMIIRSPRVRPGKFLFSDAKRLLQQYLPLPDSCTAAIAASFSYTTLAEALVAHATVTGNRREMNVVRQITQISRILLAFARLSQRARA